MDWVDEFKKRFGGFWNTILLIAGLVICLRFAGAEWKSEELQERLLFALYLILGIAATGLIWGSATAILSRMGKTLYSTPSTAAHFISGMKYGVIVGIVVIFSVGLLMVDEYLGPLKELFDVLVKKILEKIPGSGP